MAGALEYEKLLLSSLRFVVRRLIDRLWRVPYSFSPLAGASSDCHP